MHTNTHTHIRIYTYIVLFFNFELKINFTGNAINKLISLLFYLYVNKSDEQDMLQCQFLLYVFVAHIVK